MEQYDVVVKRLDILRKMNTIRGQTSDRPLFYLDQYWLNENHTRVYFWQDSHGNGGLKVLTDKLILLYQQKLGLNLNGNSYIETPRIHYLTTIRKSMEMFLKRDS